MHCFSLIWIHLAATEQTKTHTNCSSDAIPYTSRFELAELETHRLVVARFSYDEWKIIIWVLHTNTQSYTIATQENYKYETTHRSNLYTFTSSATSLHIYVLEVVKIIKNPSQLLGWVYLQVQCELCNFCSTTIRNGLSTVYFHTHPSRICFTPHICIKRYPALLIYFACRHVNHPSTIRQWSQQRTISVLFVTENDAIGLLCDVLIDELMVYSWVQFFFFFFALN